MLLKIVGWLIVPPAMLGVNLLIYAIEASMVSFVGAVLTGIISIVGFYLFYKDWKERRDFPDWKA